MIILGPRQDSALLLLVLPIFCGAAKNGEEEQHKTLLKFGHLIAKFSSRVDISSDVVPRAGFEPATLSLEVSCSIQLSYQGLVRDGVVETPSEVWKTSILTVIRIPLVRVRHPGLRKRVITCLLQPQVASSSQFCKNTHCRGFFTKS